MRLTTLKTRASFRRVMAHGRSARSNGVRVHALLSGGETNRYGIAATLAVGTAVRRNKVRRWSRELLRQWDSRLDPGYDVVVFVNHSDAIESYQYFAGHLGRALRKVQLAEGELRG